MSDRGRLFTSFAYRRQPVFLTKRVEGFGFKHGKNREHVFKLSDPAEAVKQGTFLNPVGAGLKVWPLELFHLAGWPPKQRRLQASAAQRCAPKATLWAHTTRPGC